MSEAPQDRYRSDPPRPPRFLITAGNTREAIDAVRDWGNIFTGGTGLGIAKALANLGEVDLLTSNAAHLEQLNIASDASGHRIRATRFNSHMELKTVLADLLSRGSYSAVFMTAAVADYRPDGVFEVLEQKKSGDLETWVVRTVQAEKVKSIYGSIAVSGKPTEKLVDLFRTKWGHKGLLVKFKLEAGVSVENLLRIGESSRLSSGADYLVANTLDMVRGPNPGAYLLSEKAPEWVPRPDLPGRLLQIVRASEL